MPQAAQKMLTQQLRVLEGDGLIDREGYPVVPPKTEYSITVYGRTLKPILPAMCGWGNEHMKDRILENSPYREENYG